MTGKLARTLTLGFALVGGILLSGCASDLYEPRPDVTPMQGGTIVSNTASVKNTYIHDPDDKVIVCAEPNPDAGFTQNQSSNFSFALIGSAGGSDDVGDTEGSAEEELSGRVPSVLLSRELLFRLCEFSRNHDIDSATAIELYKANLEIIHDVAGTVAGNTTVSISDSVSNASTIGVAEGAAPQDVTAGAATNATGMGYDNSGMGYDNTGSGYGAP